NTNTPITLMLARAPVFKGTEHEGAYNTLLRQLSDNMLLAPKVPVENVTNQNYLHIAADAHNAGAIAFLRGKGFDIQTIDSTKKRALDYLFAPKNPQDKTDVCNTFMALSSLEEKGFPQEDIHTSLVKVMTLLTTTTSERQVADLKNLLAHLIRNCKPNW